jgi:hypothetical protein
MASVHQPKPINYTHDILAVVSLVSSSVLFYAAPEFSGWQEFLLFAFAYMSIVAFTINVGFMEIPGMIDDAYPNRLELLAFVRVVILTTIIYCLVVYACHTDVVLGVFLLPVISALSVQTLAWAACSVCGRQLWF